MLRRLSTDKKIALLIAFAILAALLLLLLIPSIYIRWVAAVVMTFAALITWLFVKKRSIHSYNKRQVLLLITVFAVLYLVLYYLSGIHFGYGTLYGKLSFKRIITLAFPIAITAVASELVRSALLGQESRLISVIAYFVSVIAEILIAGGVHGIASAYSLMDFVGMTLFPAITSNLLFNYISKRYGILPNISYRLILKLYVYIIPFVPNAPEILPAFVLMILPLIIYVFISALFEKKKRIAKQKQSKLTYVFPAVLLVIMTGLILLVTCKFRYGILVIATESMTGEINRGDAVVFESYEHVDEVKENDIIVFSKDGNRRVVHRIVAINTVNGQKQYVTKGDANEDIDSGYITDTNIIGVVHFKVIYIGYPSLWLREIFN